MTWSAPIERTRSTFLVLHTPVTSAPSALAICTANVPTPPDAPLIRTLLARLDLAVVAQELQSGRGGHTDRGRLLEREVDRLLDELVLGRPRIFGERSRAPAEHLVARSKARATSLPTASTVPAKSVPGTRFFGFRRPRGEPHDERRAGHEDPVTDMDGSRLDADQHLVVRDLRLVDVPWLAGPRSEP